MSILDYFKRGPAAATEQSALARAMNLPRQQAGQSSQVSYKMGPSPQEIESYLQIARAPLESSEDGQALRLKEEFYPDQKELQDELAMYKEARRTIPSEVDLTPAQTLSKLFSSNPSALPSDYKPGVTADAKLKQQIELLDMIQGSKQKDFENKASMLKILSGIPGSSMSEAASQNFAPLARGGNIGRGDDLDMRKLSERLKPEVTSGLDVKSRRVIEAIGGINPDDSTPIVGIGGYGKGLIDRYNPLDKETKKIADNNWAAITDLANDLIRAQSGLAVNAEELQRLRESYGITPFSDPSVIRNGLRVLLEKQAKTIRTEKAGFRPEVVRAYESNPGAIKAESFESLLQSPTAMELGGGVSTGVKPAARPQAAPKSGKLNDMSLDQLKALRDQLKAK